MEALTQFVAQQNQWNSLFRGEQYELKSAQGRQRVADMIDAALSPENLSCDGELSRSAVNRRYRELMAAARDLQRLDPRVRLQSYDSV